MYTSKSLLLLKKFHKEQVINFEEIKRVSLASIDELKGEFIYYELPCIHCNDSKYKKILREELEYFKIQLDVLSTLRKGTTLMISDLKNTIYRSEVLEKYCDYYYSTDEVLIDLVLPTYVYKCNLIISDLKSHLVGLRNNYYLHTTEPSSNNLSIIETNDCSKLFYLLNNQQKLQYFSVLLSNFNEQKSYCLE